MKKFLLYILLFFGIVIVADFGFGYGCEWLQDHAKGGSMKSVRRAALEQNADIVVMGSSRAHHHYVCSVITDNTRLSSYNAGLDGNGIVTATGLYELMKERYTPKVVLYDVVPAFDINVYAEDGNNTRYIGWLRPYFYHPQVKNIICRIDSSEKLKNLSTMFRYNGKIFDLLKDQVVSNDYTKDGYAPLWGEMDKPPVVTVPENIIVLDTLKLNMVNEFIVRMSHSDTRLIMIASPRYGATSSDVFNPVKDMCRLYGIEFWDYYTEIEFQRMDYFKESMHLNNKGAVAFSERVAQRLIQTYIQ